MRLEDKKKVKRINYFKEKRKKMQQERNKLNELSKIISTKYKVKQTNTFIRIYSNKNIMNFIDYFPQQSIDKNGIVQFSNKGIIKQMKNGKLQKKFISVNDLLKKLDIK